MKKKEEVKQYVNQYTKPYIIEVDNPPDEYKMLFYGGGGDIKIRSSVSGKEYYFKEGIATKVDLVDALEFMKMTKVGGCCGSTNVVELFGTL